MGTVNDKIKNVIRNWLEIQPSVGDTITIQETNTFEGNCFRNLLWYRGDASELHQYYTQTDDLMGNAKFWAAQSTTGINFRKIHTGLPAMIVDMLADIIVDSFNKIEVKGNNEAQTNWEEIAKENDFKETLKQAIIDVFVQCDGAFKISYDTDISKYPIIEFYSGQDVDYEYTRGRITGINFKKASFADSLPDFLKIEIGSSKKDKTKANKPNPLDKLLKSSVFTNDFNVPLDKVERGMLRTATGLLIIFFVYSGFSMMIKKQIDNKMDEANKSIANTNSQMQLIDNDKSKLQTKTTEYTTKINNLQNLNYKINDINKTKKVIPNLLNKLMYIMPTGVQITSIQNTSDTHIEIQAQSNKYEQLGFLVTNMQLEQVLTNVISTAGQKANGIITIKIEGDLP